ncbi:HemN C- region family [Treponema primitia ZAS-2]|uniref:HemN C-region family n=1 Tax=Treponema primitia (strain ATCC BAA-887 / DSM 12427 / ZAS-2) TaxID=545694 RepID=F5YH19_TREPZ|nr:coproporphyrinogen-III oxidase family protein [Treponema primitia]AEF83897.1 HemN C- region family [Treponema primitia ZAS-2]
MGDQEASLYVHVPFCASFCDYCDFYSILTSPDDERLNLYVDVVLEEIRGLIARFKVDRVPTVYIGGGTPSVLGASRLDRLLGGIAGILPGIPASAGRISATECTLEVNPESVREDLLEVCRDRGVTRLSVGVQSFYGPSRQAVHRAGESGLLDERLSMIADYFGDSFTADIMSGLPFQDETVLLRDIEKLVSYSPGHISLYSLTLEEGTPLVAHLAESAAKCAVPGAALGAAPGTAGGTVFLPDGDEADRLWLSGRDALEQAGYAQYEVSNFSRPGREGRHNLRYWRMENWLGAGPGASGTLIDDEEGRGIRYTIPADADTWLAGGAAAVNEILDRPTLIQESLLMGFRSLEGPDTALFEKRFHCSLESLILQTLRRWEKRELLAPLKSWERREALALTREGLLFLNTFLAEAFAELDRSLLKKEGSDSA